MSARSAAWGVVLGAGFVAGALVLLGVQFSDGGVYPEYSSLRSDATGSKLLYDTLARIPGVKVERNYLPLEYVNGTGATVLVLNLNPELWSADLLLRVDALARRGNRVALAAGDFAAPEHPEPLAKAWHIRFGFDKNAPHGMRLFFKDSTGWTAIRRSGSKVTAIERAEGKGSVILLADNSAFANQEIVDSGAEGFPLISMAIGPNSRVIFDEQHFGITQSGSVVGLVRRFRLTGMALGLALCAALFIWRNVTSFPPPDTAPAAVHRSGRTSRSGLLTLLRRHVPPGELARVCWAEYLVTNRRSVSANGAARAENALHGDRPLEVLREIHSVVNSKGTI